jgi:membrane protein
MIYKVLPNVKIDWEEVWIGAAITALLFEIGKVLIGLYIGKSSVASSFGAAGPFVVLMLWIYYSTQIFLLGAEFTFAYAHRGQSKAREEDTNAAGRDALALIKGVAPLEEETLRSPHEPAGSTGSSSTWAKRAGVVSAVGLLTGLAATRLFRGNSSKFR